MRTSPYGNDVDALLTHVKNLEADLAKAQMHRCPPRITIHKKWLIQFLFPLVAGFFIGMFCFIPSQHTEVANNEEQKILCWGTRELVHGSNKDGWNRWFHVVGETGKCYDGDNKKYTLINRCDGDPELIWDHAFPTQRAALEYIQKRGMTLCQ